MPAIPALKNLTAKAITKAIRAAGIDAELIRGRDHWYYDGPAVEWAYTTTAGVYRLNHRNIEQWVEEAKRFAEDSAQRSPE